jgi:hypothetical protein
MPLFLAAKRSVPAHQTFVATTAYVEQFLNSKFAERIFQVVIILRADHSGSAV